MPENKTQQELATMCRAMEEMRNETVRERNIECALEMLADGMPYEKVVPIVVHDEFQQPHTAQFFLFPAVI